MRCTPKRLLFICTTFVFSFFLIANYEIGTQFGDGGYDVRVNNNYIPKKIPLNFVKYSEEFTVAFVLDDWRTGNMGNRSVRLLLVGDSETFFQFVMEIQCFFPNNQWVEAKIYDISENHDQPYGVYYANCPVPKNVDNLFSIKIKERNSSPIEVPITYRIPKELDESELPLKYSICVPYMFGNKYSGKRFIEFMELNHLLGVDLVTLYVNKRKMTDEMRTVLDLYETKGWLQTVQLLLPIREIEIWYHGQMLTIADCLNRHIGVSKYIAFHDLDEFVVPMEMPKLPTILDEYLANDIGSIRIPTLYFYPETEEAPVTLNNVHSLGPDPVLTKCVVRPHMVFEQGIHHTSRLIQDHYLTKSHVENKLRIFHYKKLLIGAKNEQIPRMFGEKLKRNYEAAIKILEVV